MILRDFKKIKNWYSFWHIDFVLIIETILEKSVQMLFRNKFLLFFVISVGSVIGMVRGEEAKQKWVFKIKSKVDNKKLIAEKRQLAKKGGVLLDDIEMASFHNN